MISKIFPAALKFRGQRWPHKFEFVWAWYWLNAFWFAKQAKHTKCVATFPGKEWIPVRKLNLPSGYLT